ncbi:Y-family DNA polymerase [Methylobacterium aquaticum]|uniref:DNA-directed DNA polymerase n=1 Tax=Methylobacterium aquaticum TaxID=270351 RepID=A0A0J6VJR2_9HYPH|nr:Y-family DNA polymerase [Methylobacterium aquaticum]KMO39371.1 DNA polymerase V subunit UmuC [Methylobacterium aquaticum]
MPGLVALVDCNNFYTSCERLFQPELNGKPVVVLSNNDGCVIARSNEAKALGIKMGDAYHLRKREFAAWGVQVYSSNYTLYGDISARVMRMLGEFTPELEVYSIDEAFLGLAGFSDPEGHARRLRETVGRQTGIQVCVGVAPTKTLAKVANRTAKKDPGRGGVCLLDTEEAQTAALSKLVDDIWGIGSRLAPKLAALGISTPLELRAADPVMIRQRFNVVVQRTVLELRGIPCLDLERDSPDSKTICSARSFGRAVEGFDELAEALTTYVSRSAEKLRRQGLAAAAIAVLVSTNRHKPEEPQYHATRHVRLTIATADTARLIRAALWGLREIYRPGVRYKKTGILLLDLAPAGSVQGSLFLRPDDRRRVELMGAIDAINRRYGRDRVRFAGTGLARGWKLKAEFHSPRYTTRWDELLRV